MDWDKLKIFHAVAESGSFTKASTVLNLSQSAISRQIQTLENELKIHLFERPARGLVLTDNGEYLYKTAHEVISKLKDVEATLSDEKDKLNGKLTITCKNGEYETKLDYEKEYKEHPPRRYTLSHTPPIIRNPLPEYDKNKIYYIFYEIFLFIITRKTSICLIMIINGIIIDYLFI